jgi:GMP synthase-like glutamine amidotransferase
VAAVRILVIGNRGDADAGHVGDALLARGATLVPVEREGAADLPPATQFDAVVSLGSDWSVYWDTVALHVSREAALLRDAVDAGLPVLGLCFGGQMLAHALGGSVERAPAQEIGWYAVETDVPALVPPGPYVQWHSDRFVPPPGSRELARSPIGAQAFAAGSALGLQFHPEATAQVVARWCAGLDAEQLSRIGVDADEFVAETERRAPQARVDADVLVATLLSGVLVS